MTTARHAIDLERIARQAMVDHGLEPDFAGEALRQLDGIARPCTDDVPRDLRDRPWCSIDNDDSRDLDQLTLAEDGAGGRTRVLVAVADVDCLVPRGTPLDDHARLNTTSVYTAARVFPMLPARLSTDLTSLNEGEDRWALVTAFEVDEGGALGPSEIYRARVRNQAKLAYDSAAAWLDGKGPRPAPIDRAPEVDGQVRRQDRVAEVLRRVRHEHGALELGTIEARAVIEAGQVVDLRPQERNRARLLIEDFMIAANGVSARFLRDRGLPGLRRVVRSPERWDRLEDLARSLGESLPPDPDSRALQAFLVKRRQADPVRFPDLSLTVVKLMGAGEYVVQGPGESPLGHFGLAERDYQHSTAPNRRFPDLITQRLLKAALAGVASPYERGALEGLALHCTEQEDAANKVERQVRKSAAALLLSPRVGELFDAIVTGASVKGTWVRVLRPPVEGKLVHGQEGLDVGDRLRVKLVGTDVERGYIDFALSRG